MKITVSQLRRIIQEEIQVTEAPKSEEFVLNDLVVLEDPEEASEEE